MLYNEKHYQCEQGLLNGDEMKRKNCEVTIRKAEGKSFIKEIVPGEFVLITWGETVTQRCLNTVPVDSRLEAGVYMMKISSKCTYSGEDWAVSPIKEFSGRLSIMALKVDIPPLKIKEIVPEQTSIALLNKTKFNHLEPVVRQNLRSLPEYEQIIADNTKLDDNVIILIVVGISVVLLMGIGVTMMTLYKKGKLIYSIKNKNKENITK